MNPLRFLWSNLLTAIQFLTRVPIPARPYTADSLAQAVKFFPIVGLLLGTTAALLHRLLVLHLSRPLTALLVVTFLLLLTGCLHEDGLADAADGFGGGWNREQILLILRDSRIGSYGAIVIALSVLSRILLLASLPLDRVAAYLITAHVLCRWTTLPLSFFLPPARTLAAGESEGQGARIAHLTSRNSLIVGTLFSFAIVIALLRERALIAITFAVVTTFLSGLYYKRRIGGVTGDCFGATNQLTEILVYFSGAWVL